MAAPASVDEFLDLVRKSGVADEKRLVTYLQKLQGRLPASPALTAQAMIRDGLITQFQADHLLAGKWRRFSIGKYKVLERLGSGGMGQVYLCEHKLMRRRVAVKVLPTAKAKDSSALERFYREARAVAALTHPFIVHAYDIDQDEDLHFLVMEYVDGANLQEIVKRSGPLSVLRACHYIRNSAIALQHAHEAGLVHRDVKPGNILVDRAGVVKILDLGLARFFHDEDDMLTQKYDESVLGTADYLSPEQALDSHTADIRADIYSLGATFYFLLTGRPPFESANVTQKLMMHQLKQPKAVQEYRKDVPREVLAILQKMMEKDHNQRYAVPADVADALEGFTREPIGPPPDAEMPHLSPAATGQFPALNTAETTGSSIDAPVLPLRTFPPSGSGSGSGRSGEAVPYAPVRPAARRTPAPGTVPSQPGAQASSREAAQPVPEIAPWEEIASDTEDPSAKADTAPQTSRSSSKSKKNNRSKFRRKPIVAALAILVFGISLFLTGTIGALIWYFYPAPPPPAPAAGPVKLEVSKLRPKAFPSIQAALRKAETGSVIELWDEIYEENVVIDPAKGPTGVTLQAAHGKEILWRSRNTDPIIKISKAGDFKLQGLGITLDGTLDHTRRVQSLITISSDCAGMTVADLQLKSFGREAILLTNSTGSAEEPIRLMRLTTVTDKSETPRAAIYFDAIEKMTPSRNDHIVIEDCDFRGIEPLKAIQFRNDKVIDQHVHWPSK